MEPYFFLWSKLEKTKIKEAERAKVRNIHIR